MLPVLSYDPKVDEETGEYKSSLLGEDSKFLEQLFGYTEVLYSLNSYQFSDYSRYDIMAGTEERRAKYRYLPGSCGTDWATGTS